jgi:uncharacterized membrane protein
LTAQNEEIMAFCGNCGSAIQEGQAFCPKCGASVAPPPPQAQYQQPYAPPPPPPYGAPQYSSMPVTDGLQENVAGLLCYVGIWITGIVFLIIDKRPFVRFHAAQSLVFFGGLFLLRVVLGFMAGTFYGVGLFVFGLIFVLIGLVGLVSWIVLMIFAYQGKRFEIPGVAGIAKSLMGSIKV